MAWVYLNVVILLIKFFIIALINQGLLFCVFYPFYLIPDFLLKKNSSKLTNFDGKQPSMDFSCTQPLMDDNPRWRTPFDWRWPFLKDNLRWKAERLLLMEDNLGLRTNFKGSWPFMEEDFLLKKTFDGGQTLMEVNLQKMEVLKLTLVLQFISIAMIFVSNLNKTRLTLVHLIPSLFLLIMFTTQTRSM